MKRLDKRLDALYFKLKNKAKYIIKNIQLIFDRQEKLCLGSNKEFKNFYHDKRCFIVGNGPSLALQDLSLLKEEYVFTVNYIIKSPLYKIVKSNFHILMDPDIFDFSTEMGEFKEKLLWEINQGNNKPICFAQYSVKKKLEAVGLDRILDLHYISSGFRIYDKYSKKMDLTRVVPGYSNVVLYATMIAIYMGFTDIYFIGCDMTGYEQISVMAGKKVKLHVYEMDDKEEKMINETHSRIIAETFFESFYHTFAEYRMLNDYAKTKGVHLYNATDGGVLDVLERVPYEKLFS